MYDEQGRLIKIFWSDDDAVLEYSYRTNSDGTFDGYRETEILKIANLELYLKILMIKMDY